MYGDYHGDIHIPQTQLRVEVDLGNRNVVNITSRSNPNDKSKAVGYGFENAEARKLGYVGNIASVFAEAYPGSDGDHRARTQALGQGE